MTRVIETQTRLSKVEDSFLKIEITLHHSEDRELLSLDDTRTEDYDPEETVEENTANDTEISQDKQVVTETSPRNSSCLKPAVTQFPDPLIDKKSRQQGLVLIHILVAVYMFIGLAIVCDDFFVPSLTRVSDGKY